MVGISIGRNKVLWHISHAIAITWAALLFLAGFLCVLLWTNNIVHTDTSAGGPATSTFTYLSPAVTTFSITYQVAIFGTAWNSILYVALFTLERDALPFSTEDLRYEVEKAACIVSIVGNTIYSFACFALMSTLARLAADANSTPTDANDPVARAVAASAGHRRAGQGVTAAAAGMAGATAAWSAFMDWQHERNSRHRRNVKGPRHRGDESEAVKEA